MIVVQDDPLCDGGYHLPGLAEAQTLIHIN
jgi:hypothetical protein